MILCPFWADYALEGMKQLEGPAKWIAPSIVFLIVLVFGPLWYAFEESKEKDKAYNELAGQVAAKDQEINTLRTTANPKRSEKLEKIRWFIEHLRNCQTLLSSIQASEQFGMGHARICNLDPDIKEFLRKDFPEKELQYLGNYLNAPNNQHERMHSFSTQRLTALSTILFELENGI